MSFFTRIFRRPAPPETRSALGYSALMMTARADMIAGRRGVAEATAAVQSCVGFWENGLALADVSGTSLMTPPLLAAAARSLALRGEWLALIGDGSLIPAADWDVTTSDGRPRAYRLSLPDAGGGRSLTTLAGEVVHVVLAPNPQTPWVGVAPLRRAQLSADLMGAVETALADVFANAPIGSSIVPMPEMPDEDLAGVSASFQGKRGRVMLRESTAVTAAGGMAPTTDWRPHALSPVLKDAMLIESWDRTRDSISSAFGVHPSLLAADGQAAAIREAQRGLAVWTLAPLARLIATELTAKLAATVEIDPVRPVQAWDAGGRARAFSAVVRGIAEAKAAGLSEAETAAARRLVGWGGDGATE
ncbi:MAG: phage portal protein [Pseudomonadota bacterium]